MRIGGQILGPARSDADVPAASTRTCKCVGVVSALWQPSCGH